MRQLSQLEIDIYIFVKRHPGLTTDEITADWNHSFEAIAAVQYLHFAQIIKRHEVRGWVAV